MLFLLSMRIRHGSFVVLPHTYNSEDGAGRTMDMSENRGDYYHGSVCYRRSLVLSSEECEGKEVYLEFEGSKYCCGSLYKLADL